jgi:hypothetical protein
LRRLGLPIAVAFVALALLPAAAGAALGPIQLESTISSEQADEAATPALSADGAYLAFQGSIGGLEGVFRKNLKTGEVVPVAAATPGSGVGTAADAHAPLDPVDDPAAASSDVYVADMSTAPPTYEMASVEDGCSPGASLVPCGLAYEGTGGSIASGRSSLSADGRRIAFVTTAPSNLTSGPTGSTPGVETPAGQVVLRDLATNTTTLVSVRRDAETGQPTEPSLPVEGGAVMNSPVLPLLTGASLSADGTTIAWIGTHIASQVPLLGDEAQTIEALDSNGTFPYDEPLWRRIADGPSAPTRRIIGGGDPLAPGCPQGGTLEVPACQGPFPSLTGKDGTLNSAEGWIGVPRVDGVPQLSANGRTVALIGNPTEATNLFLVDMAPDLSRVQAVRRLTRDVPVDPNHPATVINQEPYVPLNGHIFDLALSPDGTKIAFASARQKYPLAPPNLISQPPAQLGLVELFLMNLKTETLQRVTHGKGGADEASLGTGGDVILGDGATSPSFGAEGGLLAFASTAANLIAGDGNDASDVFMVEDAEPSQTPGAVTISAGPRKTKAKRSRRLHLVAFSQPDGGVRLIAFVPRAGRLRARVTARLAVGGPQRVLARAWRRSRAAGKSKISLELPPQLRHLARARGGIYALARVAFHARHGKGAQAKVKVHFHVHRKKRAK